MPEITKLIEKFESLSKGLPLQPGTYKVVAQTWEVLACACVPGSTFAFDKSFIRPSVVESLKGLSQSMKDHPQCKVLVFGHTDKVGDEAYNSKLSTRRAKSAYAFVTNDTDLWESLYQEEHWGLESEQEMLADLGYYAGTIDGKDGPETQAAVKAFRASEGMSESGTLDKETRKHLFAAYMTGKHDIVAAPDQFLDPKFVGCGEFNPIIDTEEKEEANRRISFFLFHPDKLPKIPCKPGDIGPCKKMMKLEGARHKESFKCAFFDNISRDCHCEGGGGKPDSLFISNLKWEKAEAICGDMVKIGADTLLNEGTEVEIKLKPLKGDGAPAPLAAKVAGKRIEAEWDVKDVSFFAGKEAFPEVDVEASIDAKGETATNAAPLKIKGFPDAAAQVFTSDKKWGIYSNHAEFTQTLKDYRNQVYVGLKAVKAWGATYIDMSSVFNGKAGGCPWDGYRWGRGTGVNAMVPNEYHDGSGWKAFPKAFKLKPDLYGTLAFYKDGKDFKQAGGTGTWPEAFADYDFDSAAYTKRRKEWVDTTHTVWTDSFNFRRKDCKSKAANHCCLYSLEVKLEFLIQAKWADGVTAICPGDLRSNTATWFMGDSRLEMAAHETGHHMDNPDEYLNGAVDTTLNGDGAVNGIDADCIMGQNMTKVKKRHCHAFADMQKRLIKKAYGKEYEYDTVAP